MYADGLNLISDAETEDFLSSITSPMLATSGINPQNVQLFVINDGSINAFVAGGENIFINTGLLQLSSDPDILIGVLAHEIGHISSRHLILSSAGSKDILKNSAVIALGAIAVAAAASVGGTSGGGDLIMATLSGTEQLIHRQALSYTRSQEREADKRAVETLNRLGYSTGALLKVFEALKMQEKRFYSSQDIDQYAQTHPLTESRIEYVRDVSYGTRIPKKVPEVLVYHFDIHKRLLLVAAKFAGYLKNSDTLSVSQDFLIDEDSKIYYEIYKDIAMQIVSKSTLSKINQLLKNHAQYPYFYEARGIINFKLKNISESIADYKRAIKLQKEEFKCQLKVELTDIIIAEANIDNKKGDLGYAKNLMFGCLQNKKVSALARLKLSIIYGMVDDLIMSKIYLASYYEEIGKVEQSRRLAGEAKSLLAKTDKTKYSGFDIAKALLKDLQYVRADNNEES